MYGRIFDKKGKEIAFVDEVESFYDEETILFSLNKSGFKNVKFVDMDLNEIDNFERNRIFIICKKE